MDKTIVSVVAIIAFCVMFCVSVIYGLDYRNELHNRGERYFYNANKSKIVYINNIMPSPPQ